MPGVSFPSRIVVVNTPEEAAAAVAELAEAGTVGFDTETRPSFRKGEHHKAALIQVSTADTCYLFRINRFGLTPEVINMLENRAIVKVGLSLHDDFTVMHRQSGFNPGGFIDLQKFVRPYGIADSSLQKIYAIIFGERISKSQRLTNWEAPELTLPQQQYAAIDAWACLRIYNTLTGGNFDPSACHFTPTTEAQ